jgi:hypothetical protein
MTSPSPLERLAGPGNVLAKEAPDAKEFEGLVSSGLARLKDAENAANSLESRFDLAYGAAHALCLAALRHHGFRPSKRYIAFQVLPDTLGLAWDLKSGACFQSATTCATERSTRARSTSTTGSCPT